MQKIYANKYLTKGSYLNIRGPNLKTGTFNSPKEINECQINT